MRFPAAHVATGNDNRKKLTQCRRQYAAHLMTGCPRDQRQAKIVFVQPFQERSGAWDKPHTEDFLEAGFLRLQYFMGTAGIDGNAILRGKFSDALEPPLPLAAIHVMARHRDADLVKNDFPATIVIRHRISNNTVHVQDNGMDVQSQFCHEYDYIKRGPKDKGFSEMKTEIKMYPEGTGILVALPPPLYHPLPRLLKFAELLLKFSFFGVPFLLQLPLLFNPL